MDEFSLQGRVAIVTGASRGIGRAIALRLARAGARVVLSSRKLDGVQAVADEIEAAGCRALAVQAHMGRTEEVQALVAQTMERFGRVDVAISNAGTNPHFGPLLTADEGQWDKILDINAKGAFRLVKAVVPVMQAQGGGKFIAVASLAGLRPSPGMGLYGISKAALILLTQQLAMELGPANIQANVIAPGIIRTGFSQVLWQTPAISEAVLGRMPAGRFGEVQDVAGLALFLASPASDYVTGAVFVVDGGLSVAPVLG